MRRPCGGPDDRGGMAHTPRRRDAYRLAVASVTALTSVAAAIATGWLAGSMDREARQQEQAERDAARRAEQEYRAALARHRIRRQGVPVLTKPRPTSTRVVLRYVAVVPATGVGPGGTVSAGSAGGSSSGGSSGVGSRGSGGGSGTTSSGPVPAPPPPPPPLPAPSSGS